MDARDDQGVEHERIYGVLVCWNRKTGMRMFHYIESYLNWRCVPVDKTINTNGCPRPLKA